MKYVKEAWYPVVWADRVGRELTRHVVLEEPIVMYRLQDGKIAALQDACPHRLAPLSLGKLKGDNIECGYHGMTFDCAGQVRAHPGTGHHSRQRTGSRLSSRSQIRTRLALHGRSEECRSEKDLPHRAI